jgi:uncharacterized protein YqgC (DUF456 family)
MDILWMLVGAVLLIVGLAGCILPFLPGPPLSYAALLVQQLRSIAPFSSEFLWIMAGITTLVVVLEFAIPVYGAKRYGGSKFGMWGCTIGLLVGMWLGPVGLIVGPFLGALVGELLFTDSSTAIRAAMGSFIGFLAGTLLKLIACFVMIWYYVISL